MSDLSTLNHIEKEQEYAWRVLKFGGSSVSSLQDWQNIKSIVTEQLEQGYKLLVVHSAFKDVTNQLEQLSQLAQTNQQHELFVELVNEHNEMAASLGVGKQILEPWFDSLQAYLAKITESGQSSVELRASVVAHGELLSSSLGAAYLHQELKDFSVLWQDAREQLVSFEERTSNLNEQYLNAVCHPSIDKELANSWAQTADLVLSQGFIAANQAGRTVLLGREGSDTSAAYFASILQAEALQIWTDVAGMFSCDPNKVDEPKKIAHLSYIEAYDMAQAGAKVLHPRCLSAVRPYNIPIEIRCTHRPTEAGTVISGDYQESKWIKAIALKQGIATITLLLGRRGQQADTLHKVFNIINEFGLTCELLASTKESLVIAIETTNSLYDEETLDQLTIKLAEVCRSVLLSHSAMISLIGCQASQALWHLMQVNAELPEQWLLLSHTSSDHHLSFLLDEQQAEDILQLLHKSLIK